jgi:hypothetical protein
MKKTIATIIAMTLILTVAAYGQSYDFNSISKNRISLEAYIDGERVLVSGNQVRWDNTESWFRMYVDTQALTTTIQELHCIQGEKAASHTGRIKQGGFGGLDVPFTIHITNSYVHSSRIRGTYDIDWHDLSFHMKEINEDDEPMHFVGYAEVEGKRFDFSISTPRAQFTINDVSGQFDDAGYPDKLTVSFSCEVELGIC